VLNWSAKLEIYFELVQTKNLLLRTPENEDAWAVFVIHSDPETNRYNPSGPMKNLNEATKSLQEWIQDWENNGFGYWSVLDSSTCEIIGVGGIRRMHYNGRDVLNLYYRFSPKSWGRGYATELARTAVNLAGRYLPGLPIVARIRPSNVASIRVAEKAGLKHTHELYTSEYVVLTLGWR